MSTKRRILTLAKILREKTDSSNALTIKELCDELGKKGLRGCYDTVKDDIKCLEASGYSIETVDKCRYYLKGDLHLWEMILLSDFISSLYFISTAQKKHIISVLCTLCSKEDAEVAESFHDFDKETCAANPEMEQNIVISTQALKENTGFYADCLEYSCMHKLNPNGDSLHFIPTARYFENGKYWLSGYDERIPDELMTIQLNKIANLKLMEKPKDETNKRKPTLLYGDTIVHLMIPNTRYNCNAVVEKFGNSVIFSNSNQTKYEIKVRLKGVDLREFFGSLLSIGAAIDIIQPHVIRECYLFFLTTIHKIYAQTKIPLPI